MNINQIRNFSIIAHIDHGKSTLADRMIEATHTIEKRKMKDQVLDSMDLERERGITIKMQPISMNYELGIKNNESHQNSKFKIQNLGSEYILNLIDTPGHIDFSYEVSRALKAVEGSVLLVDSTQGVQAQTLTTLEMAQNLGLKIIPVLSKVDSPLARVEEIKKEVSVLLNCDEGEILETSGKTGRGVSELLEAIVERVSSPEEEIKSSDSFRSLVFDFEYSNHRGVIVYVRVTNGKVSKGDKLKFKISDKNFSAIEVGVFSPGETPRESLEAGQIGYIVTGIKEPGVASVGDTVASLNDNNPPLPGYQSPSPVVWSSLYPESQDDFTVLRQALERLKLSDSSFSFEEEASGVLGRGFRCGFLGMLHLEIVTERLRREFDLDIVVTSPSITYEVEQKNGKREKVYSSAFFPEEHLISKVFEPWADLKIIVPNEYLGNVLQVLFEHEAELGDSENFGNARTSVSASIALRELMRNFFDKIKSVSSGYASVSYKIADLREADVVKMEILVADEPVPAFSRIVSKKTSQEEAEKTVEKLYKLLPKQMFTTKIQAKAFGRIISSKTLSAMKKDVTAGLYGGDITRKRKLWEKQKKGKKKMKERGKVNIPNDVFLKMMRAE